MFLEKDRHYTLVDKAISHVDHVIRTLVGTPLTTDRPNPACDVPAAELTSAEAKHVAGLMRVNHAGEVAAQGLYQGQALTARLDTVKDQMTQAAREENDHLAWCRARLQALGSHTSYLDPVWYTGSLLIGMIAGLAGDEWSLGFVEETEHQVTAHLDDHFERLPESDKQSAAIIDQMRIDEQQHAASAHAAGAADLPSVIKVLMQCVAKVMTSGAYHI